VALNGGDPGVLSFKTFLDISYALLVQEYRDKGGMNLIAALEQAQEYASGPGREKTVSSVEAQNQASLEQLAGMLKGVSK